MFFENAARRKALAQVLDAPGCREGWLQGELFREFRDVPGFRINMRRAGSTGVPDLACGREMIGELKILGSGYQRKCITGGALRPFLVRRSEEVGRADRGALSLGNWGIIPDYFRLCDARGLASGAERLLILVADVQPGDAGDVVAALESIRFKCRSPPVEISMTRGFVRLWDVGVQ